MKLFSTAADAVNDLHGKGFIYDFILSGNDLLWIQESSFIRAGQFAILEYHEIAAGENGNASGIIVFGIIALHHNAKGILINHYKNNSAIKPPVLLRKLNELSAQPGNELQTG